MVRWLLQVAIFIITLTLILSPQGRGEGEGFVHTYAADLNVEELLRKVDDVRIPNTDFSVEVTIETESSGTPRVSKYEVMMNSNRDALVKTNYPPNEKGQVMLMKGKDFWVYLPNVDQPVRLSLSQRLTGQVSNGDIARMSFSGDYKAALLRIEESDGKRVAVLELNKAADWVAYEKVILWVALSDT
ncbi:MAG: outer membrane lipoprotein-sorting protein, partial [Nitrospirae bacterium]|nr:outer membrane lipoprotein-sorting protein [Nitrospirota bacterium]